MRPDVGCSAALLMLVVAFPVSAASVPDPVVVIRLGDTEDQRARVERYQAEEARRKAALLTTSTTQKPKQAIPAVVAVPVETRATVAASAEPMGAGWRGWFGPKSSGGAPALDDATRIEAEASDNQALSPREQRRLARERGTRGLHSTYDDHFRKYAKRYFGVGSDWRWFKAQAMIESELKPMARSHVGAMGIMQIMPRTYAEIKRRNPFIKDPFDPYFNIAAGIYYNRQLYEAWGDIADDDERRKFMFASYNAGLSRVKQARKTAGSSQYAVVEKRLSQEPRQYVVKIHRELRRQGAI